MMIVLIGALLVGVAVGQHGPVHDTPEVAAAKAAHFAAVAQAGGQAPHASGWAGGPVPGAHGSWGGPSVGPVQDTPEVAAARAAHLAALNSANSGGAPAWGQQAPAHNDDGQWHGDGAWNKGPNQNDGQWHGEGVWNQGVNVNDGQWHGEGVWNQGPAAGHAGGLPVDTPEVAAARAAHLAAHQQTAGHNRWRRSPARNPASRVGPTPIPNSRPFPLERQGRANRRG